MGFEGAQPVLRDEGASSRALESLHFSSGKEDRQRGCSCEKSKDLVRAKPAKLAILHVAQQRKLWVRYPQGVSSPSGATYDGSNLQSSVYAYRLQHQGSRPTDWSRSEGRTPCLSGGGLTRELKGKALAVNGMEEHVHLLVSLPPTIAVSDALRFYETRKGSILAVR
jgi:hypothetical protein